MNLAIHALLLRKHQSFSNVESVDWCYAILKSQSAVEGMPVAPVLKRQSTGQMDHAPFLDAKLLKSRVLVTAH